MNPLCSALHEFIPRPENVVRAGCSSSINPFRFKAVEDAP